MDDWSVTKPYSCIMAEMAACWGKHKTHWRCNCTDRSSHKCSISKLMLLDFSNLTWNDVKDTLIIEDFKL